LKAEGLAPSLDIAVQLAALAVGTDTAVVVQQTAEAVAADSTAVDAGIAV
jgi:hypothetical protein